MDDATVEAFNQRAASACWSVFAVTVLGVIARVVL